MKYYSLNSPGTFVDFREATIRGQAPDKGLYFPEEIPQFPPDFLRNLKNPRREEIAFRIIQPYVGDTLPESELRRIVAETINFDFPLVPITPDIWSLELFHGPTLAFKDVGARFMSRCLGYFVKDNTRPVTVLVATSGDTGGAVASGFYDMPRRPRRHPLPLRQGQQRPGTPAHHPRKEYHRPRSRGNLRRLPAMVKEAFADPTSTTPSSSPPPTRSMSPAGSPSSSIIFLPSQQWPDNNHPPVISVPSGNFGNICAGLLAHRSGLPVRHFIAACNANDIVPAYLRSGDYQPKPPSPPSPTPWTSVTPATSSASSSSSIKNFPTSAKPSPRSASPTQKPSPPSATSIPITITCLIPTAPSATSPSNDTSAANTRRKRHLPGDGPSREIL